MENKRSQLKIGVILNYINMGVGSLIPIFYTPIMLNLLGQSEYGLYKLATGVTSYLSLISLGISSAVTRYLIKASTEDGKDAEENVLGLFVFIFRIIAFLSLVVGLVLTINLERFYGASLNNDELQRMMVLVFLMACNTALNFSITPYISVVNAHERFVFFQCMNIVTTYLSPILNLLILFMGYASIGLAISALALSVLIRYGYLYYVRKILAIKPNFQKMPMHLIKEIMVFSFWIFVASVVNQLYNATDTVMIGAVPALGTIGVAVYNIGGTFNSIVFSLTTGVSSMLTPRTNKMVFSGVSDADLTDWAIKAGRIQAYLVALVVTGFIAFGKPFIELYAGPGYEEAYWVAVLMMLPNAIPLVQSVCLSVIVAKNKHRFRSLVYLGIAIINVIGTWILMRKYGIIGAAFMTGIAVLIGQGFIMNWYYSRKTGLQILRFWKNIGGIFIIPIALCLATTFLSKKVDFYNIKVMLIGIVIYTFGYCVLSYVFVFNSYEKSLIKELILDRIHKESV